MLIENSLLPSTPSAESKWVCMWGMSKALVVDWMWLLSARSDETMVIDPFLNCEQTRQSGGTENNGVRMQKPAICREWIC